MLTPKMTGIFDCRKYDQTGKKQHDQREMLADTDNVTFSALVPIDQVPDCYFTDGKLDEFARPRASKKERQAADVEGREPIQDVVSLKFKVGANCKWFDKHAQAMERPTNVELEKNRWNVQIDFNKKLKDAANPLKPSGYWVNAIMVSPIEDNPFTGQAFEEVETPSQEDEDGDGVDLPFTC